MSNRTAAHGLTAEINRKIASNYDVDREIKARHWITELTGHAFEKAPGMKNFHEELMDGHVLCKLVNVIRPGIVKKVNTSKMAFKQHENINFFINACITIGVKNIDTFQTVDLYENRNMGQVVNTIFQLSAAAKKSGYDGPSIGVKIADANKREFDEETLAKGREHSSLFTAGTNKGASQAGSTAFGTQRKL